MTSKTFDQIRELVVQDNVLELARYAADIGANLNTVDVNGRGLLHAAVHSKAGDSLQWLLDLGNQQVDLADNHGETPLMRAAWLGYQPAVEMLLEAGASLKATSRVGGTPLHFAYAGGTPAVKTVQALLDAGADPAITDASGSDPASWRAQAESREQGAALLAAANSPRRLALPRRTK